MCVCVCVCVWVWVCGCVGVGVGVGVCLCGGVVTTKMADMNCLNQDVSSECSASFINGMGTAAKFM